MSDMPSADETLLRGHWVAGSDGRTHEDATCLRIRRLRDALTPVARDASGWLELYRDPRDGRLWELSFPASARQGGGPPSLAVIDRAVAEARFSRRLVSLALSGAVVPRPAPRAEHRLLPLDVLHAPPGRRGARGSLLDARFFSPATIDVVRRLLALEHMLREEAERSGDHERSRRIARAFNLVDDRMAAACADAVAIEEQLFSLESATPPIAAIEAPIREAAGRCVASLEELFE